MLTRVNPDHTHTRARAHSQAIDQGDTPIALIAPRMICLPPTRTPPPPPGPPAQHKPLIQYIDQEDQPIALSAPKMICLPTTRTPPPTHTHAYSVCRSRGYADCASRFDGDMPPPQDTHTHTQLPLSISSSYVLFTLFKYRLC